MPCLTEYGVQETPSGNTYFFSEQSLSKKFICTEQRMTCICEGDDGDDVPSKLYLLTKKYPFFYLLGEWGETAELQSDTEVDINDL